MEQNRDGLEGWNQIWFRAGIRFETDLSCRDFFFCCLGLFLKGSLEITLNGEEQFNQSSSIGLNPAVINIPRGKE